jgi:adenosylmethionine-8-amino-7-oxononanoate aminotransferase
VDATRKLRYVITMPASPEALEDLALEHLWIHESPRRELVEHDMLRVFTHGEGPWLIDTQGRRYFDLCSSMWQTPLGHGRQDITEAMAAQARKVATAGPIFFTTEAAVELAERLAASTPGDLNRCYLTSSGSEATETALKLARQYHRIRGDHHRYKFISRYGAYHGAGTGGTAISGRRHKDAFYYPLMPGAVHVMPPTGHNDIEAAEEIRTKIELEGPDTVAAVIGEPVSITEFRIPGRHYWPRVREICDEYGVLLIADETLVGCCRSGRLWAIEHWDVVPDVMVVAKSLSGGYAPVASMIVREHVYEAFGDTMGSPSVQSYGGHGASAAAAAKALEIYVDERMHEVAQEVGAALMARLESVRSRPIVREVRRFGCWIGIELMNPATGESLAQGLRGGYDVARELTHLLLQHGCAAARMSEGILHVAPPYVSTPEDLAFAAETVEAVLDEMEPLIASAAT